MSMGEQKLFAFPGRPEVDIFYASANLFEVLQLQPIAGRFFNQKEQLDSFQPSAILSYHAWQTYYGGELSAIGKKVQIVTLYYYWHCP